MNFIISQKKLQNRLTDLPWNGYSMTIVPYYGTMVSFEPNYFLVAQKGFYWLDETLL
jgi:hypothetical protein